MSISVSGKRVPFAETLVQHGVGNMRKPLEVVQVNFGKLCNQSCAHCHVEAGPKRAEIMVGRTIGRVLELVSKASSVHTVDITGGAPELNPHFRQFVSAVRALRKNVIDRCNLSVLLEKGQETTARFLHDERVRIVASLPCYSKDNVDQQRGDGVFEKSLRALKLLNELGYGIEGTGLELDLVYNPSDAVLPPNQADLEKSYRDELKGLSGIEFNRLYTITNMPIGRFLCELERSGNFQAYMECLAASFNPQAALGVMCNNLVSVGWDGRLYDCDFNQMLGIPLGRVKRSIWDVESLEAELAQAPIAFADHCYGCTAGAGSSCRGSLAR